MPHNRSSEQRKAKPLFIGIAVAAAVILSIVGAAFWPGYDAQKVATDDATMWALQTASGKRYARVNTDLRELDTVRGAEAPTQIIQYEDRAVVFVDGNQHFSAIDPVAPSDFEGDMKSQMKSASGDVKLVNADNGWVLFLFSNGDVHVSRVEDVDRGLVLNPYQDDEVNEDGQPPKLEATAASMGAKDDAIVYSAQDKVLRRFDTRSGRVISKTDIDFDTQLPLLLSEVGSKWVALDEDTGQLWIEGIKNPVKVDIKGISKLQAPSAAGSEVYIADEGGLWSVPLSGTTPVRAVELTTGAVPAQPIIFDGAPVAAWLQEGKAGGILWSEKNGETALSYGAGELSNDIDPRLVSNGSRLMLNETKTGWVWTGIEGELVRSSQLWDVDDDVVVTTEETKVAKVTTPKPPVAEPDTFGVRAGRSVTLPVLLNDHDPNEDILSIAPGSLTGLPEEFGTVEISNDGQNILANISPDASGSATFTYQATDGTTIDGLNSNRATVTLNVIPEDVAEAPVWCGVNNCLAQWPSPTVAPGGTVSTQILGAWVDPAGDEMYLSNAEVQTDQGTVIANPNGVVTFAHNDPNATDAKTIPIKLTVTNTRGQTANKTLNIQVTASPKLELIPAVFEGVKGEPLQVNLSEYITGQKGVVSLVAVNSMEPEEAEISISEGQPTFTFRAEEARSFPLQVTLKDEIQEITSAARIVLNNLEDTQVSVNPINVFVRPEEDTTIDTLAAATNPTDSVLMINDLHVQPAPGAEVFADVVGQRFIHVSGSTESGEPGLLGIGSYSISDGTPSPNAAAVGQVTFILLPTAEEIIPIAVDKNVSVITGGQIDIPVLDDDIAPVGTQIVIDPASIENESEKGLAFATNRLVRYLAPTEPGEFVIGYTIYNAVNPDLTASANIFIDVQPVEDETVPIPSVLYGRALSGTEISIPFDRSHATLNGINVELDEIVRQPKQGIAAITPEGDAIRYSSNPGSKGQDSFEYQVIDAAGLKGKAEVQIGVADIEVNPAPITHSSYVQVEQNGQVTVDPVSTDESPTGAALELIEVIPNAPESTPEYARLERLLENVDTDTGEVLLKAGPDLGTNSYIYTVRSSAGDTATGLIVTKVVRNHVQEFPVVTDTALTAETLPLLPKGVDVITGRTTWNTGPIADLNVELYGDQPNYSVSGWDISGAVPKKSQIVPFKVFGKDFSGKEVETYAFLRVPTEKETRLALKNSKAEIEVKEGKSVSVDLAEAIPVPRGEKLVIDTAKVVAVGARTEGKCTVSGKELTYSAGIGAPWQDGCVIPAKLESQETFTFLRMNVKVISKDPIPRLRAGAVTVSPGETQNFDLNQLVEWDGEPQWEKIEFSVVPSSDFFEIDLDRSNLRISGNATSRPSRIDPMTVTLPSYPDVTARTLSVTVGPAPSLLPVGANVARTCEARAGVNQCVIPVVGIPGEINPLPTVPLKVVWATGTNCSNVNLNVASDREVVASWPDGTDGGRCSGRFVVQDAQGRTSNSGGNVTIDLKGSPRPPASISWKAYGQDSVVLSVVPGANESYPKVTGYKVQADGVDVGTCRDGTCTVTGLDAGVAKNFTAVSINEIGESAPTKPVRAWAYRGPAAPAEGASTPVGDTPEGNLAKLVITGIDVARTSTLDITDLGDVPVTDATMTIERYGTSPGGKTVTVTAKSKFEQPPADVRGPKESLPTLTIANVRGIGTPRVTAEVSQGDGEQRTIRVEVTDPMGASESELIYGIAEGTQCTPSGKEKSKQIVVNEGETRTYTACAQSKWSTGSSPVGVSKPVNATRKVQPPRSAGQYTLDKNYVQESSNTYVWNKYLIEEAPQPQGDDLRYSRDPKGTPGEFPAVALGFGVDPGPIYVFRCVQNECSEPLQMFFNQSNGPSTPTRLTLLTGGQKCPPWTGTEPPFNFQPSPGKVPWGWTNEQEKSSYWLKVPWGSPEQIEGACQRTDKPVEPEPGDTETN